MALKGLFSIYLLNLMRDFFPNMDMWSQIRCLNYAFWYETRAVVLIGITVKSDTVFWLLRFCLALFSKWFILVGNKYIETSINLFSNFFQSHLLSWILLVVFCYKILVVFWSFFWCVCVCLCVPLSWLAVNTDRWLRVICATKHVRLFGLEGKVKLTSSCFSVGDGTMLLAASKVFDKFKPVIGVNTDPER